MDIEEFEPVSGDTTFTSRLGVKILDGVQELIEESERESKPLEIEPYRARLFELFATADASGLIPDDQATSAADTAESEEGAVLSADEICRHIAARSGLDQAAQTTTLNQQKLPPEHLRRMRSLWSVMRMWMEWSYAWRRWQEFHQG